VEGLQSFAHHLKSFVFNQQICKISSKLIYRARFRSRGKDYAMRPTQSSDASQDGGDNNIIDKCVLGKSFSAQCLVGASFRCYARV
jgi:hypothetical protein